MEPRQSNLAAAAASVQDRGVAASCPARSRPPVHAICKQLVAQQASMSLVLLDHIVSHSASCNWCYAPAGPQEAEFTQPTTSLPYTVSGTAASAGRFEVPLTSYYIVQSQSLCDSLLAQPAGLHFFTQFTTRRRLYCVFSACSGSRQGSATIFA